MLNFELYNPTQLVFGKGQIEQLPTLVPQNAKILLAYGGGSIFKNGVYDQVKTSLLSQKSSKIAIEVEKLRKLAEHKVLTKNEAEIRKFETEKELKISKFLEQNPLIVW